MCVGYRCCFISVRFLDYWYVNNVMFVHIQDHAFPPPPPARNHSNARLSGYSAGDGSVCKMGLVVSNDIVLFAYALGFFNVDLPK